MEGVHGGISGGAETMLTEMPSRWTLAILCVLALAGCKKQSLPSTTPPPAADNQITGRERLGWNQLAVDAAEVATLKYAIAIDGVGSELLGVTCDSNQTSEGFACTAPLPALTPGPHVLYVFAGLVIGVGSALVSPPSPPLSVTVVPAAATSGTAPAPVPKAGLAFTTADGIRLRFDPIAESLVYPT